MPFQKNKSGNPAGRPKGSKNKVNEKLRKMLTGFLVENFEQIEYDFGSMKPYTRAKLYTDLLPFVLPKLNNNKSDVRIEDLTEQDLDTIITELKIAQ